MTERPASGIQIELAGYGYRAVVASVGATLRRLRFGDRDLVLPFDADEIHPRMESALLAPWPNRTADARYTFGGREHQLTVNEPSTGNASHGLISRLDFVPTLVEADKAVLTGVLEPQPGYPWRLRFDVAFVLAERGLLQEVVATNLSDEPAPYGLGGHPYLVAGPSPVGTRDAVAEWRLECPADRVLLVDPERLLPVGLESVDEHPEFDFRAAGPARTIGGAVLNHAFTDLVRDEVEYFHVRVTDAIGIGAEIAWDVRCPWVQIYTADDGGSAHRCAVAVEPMTCPPDALNSGTDLHAIAPGESVSAGWRIGSVA